MAIQAQPLSRPSFPARRPAEGRRLAIRPGIAAVVGALLTAAVSFAILMGATRIEPDETATLILIGVNAAFVALLLALIGREARRIVLARRRGKAAALRRDRRLHDVHLHARPPAAGCVPALGPDGGDVRMGRG